jgi:hypothetical protein
VGAAVNFDDERELLFRLRYRRPTLARPARVRVFDIDLLRGEQPALSLLALDGEGNLLGVADLVGVEIVGVDLGEPVNPPALA